MAKITQIFFLIFYLLFFSCQKERTLKLGVERTTSYLPLLENKKVGVVGNQTSMIGNTHLVDSLLSLGIDVVKVFSPEHGFRGTADAGAKIEDGIDVLLFLFTERTKNQVLNNYKELMFLYLTYKM